MNQSIILDFEEKIFTVKGRTGWCFQKRTLTLHFKNPITKQDITQDITFDEEVLNPKPFSCDPDLNQVVKFLFDIAKSGGIVKIDYPAGAIFLPLENLYKVTTGRAINTGFRQDSTTNNGGYFPILS